MTQKHVFQTEVQELLHLVIHSLYSNRDIFLRELIANANDAIDKCRFHALTQPDLNTEWTIRVSPNNDAKTLTISDNGVGMTQEDLIQNLGTIAKSGTRAFLDKIKEDKESGSIDLIGQFGVGFYSSFMVADKVQVISRAVGSTEAWSWTSEGGADYEIAPAERPTPGTDIILHLKEDAVDYLTEWRIREIVSKYADFVEHPIKMWVTRKKDDTEEKIDEILNSQKAIWRKQPSEVTTEEYDKFFAHLAHFGPEKPMRHIHFRAEGTTSFTSLLYIPSKAPFDMFQPDSRKRGLQLYVRRVFITDSCKELIPEYLRFVKGVVESNDLPLNVSREILQDNPHIKAISKNIVRKVLGELQNIQDNAREDYNEFWKEFSRPLKEGLRSDYLNADKIKDLLMYETLRGEPGKLITLKEYVAAMPEEQKEILYFIGESREQIEASPLIEQAKAKGYDVLFMMDPIDEWISSDISSYQDKPLKIVSKGTGEVSDDDKKLIEKFNEEYKALTAYLVDTLKDYVGDVKITTRLTDSPACLVRAEYEHSAQLERFLKAMNQPVPESKPTLEINPNHPMIVALLKRCVDNKEDAKLSDYAHMIMDQALLVEGSPIKNLVNFSKRLTNLMTDLLKG